METFDVVIVGAGFAGSIAAQRLSASGRTVVVLEARDRIGGRTWYSEFGDSSYMVEFGGTWVCPNFQPHVRELIDAYGLELVSSPEPQVFSWPLCGKKITAPFPLPAEEWTQFERVIAHLDSNAARIRFGEERFDEQHLSDLDVSFREFVDGVNPPPHGKEVLDGFVGLYFGCASDEVSALHVLSWIAAWDNASIAALTELTEKFKGGTVTALAAIHNDMNANLRLNSPVASIEQNDSEVVVTTREGSRYRAATAIVATPINTWTDIQFTPKLSGSHDKMPTQKHAGQAAKVWALVEGLEGNFYGVGSESTLKWVATEYVYPEGQLVVGFGFGSDLNPDDHDAVRQAFTEFLPEGNVVAVDGHDWNGDEYSQGTWLAYRPGQITQHVSNLLRPQSRVVFAGSDLATGWAGWIDGALESGKRGAAEIDMILNSATG